MYQIKVLLENELNQRKAKNVRYSLRAFSKSLQISPAQLSQIISGKRPITSRVFKKIVNKLELSPLEIEKYSEYNEQLKVQDLNQIKLAEDQFKLIADWVHLALLSLANSTDKSNDIKAIAKKLDVSSQVVRDCLNRLTRMGLISLNPILKQLVPHFTVSSEIGSQAIQKYHKDILNLAQFKLNDVEPSKREYQSIMIPIKKEAIPILKKEVDSFVNKINLLAKKNKGNMIYSLNIQLFPISLEEKV